MLNIGLYFFWFPKDIIKQMQMGPIVGKVERGWVRRRLAAGNFGDQANFDEDPLL